MYMFLASLLAIYSCLCNMELCICTVIQIVGSFLSAVIDLQVHIVHSLQPVRASLNLSAITKAKREAKLNI